MSRQLTAHIVVALFLLSRCEADVERQVKEIKNNQTAGIIFSAKSSKMSGNGDPSDKLKSDEWMSDNYIGTIILERALEIEATANKSLSGRQKAYGIIFRKPPTLQGDYPITSDSSTDHRNVVDLATSVFIATSGGPYLLNFRGVNVGSSYSVIKSSGTWMALLLVNGIIRATSYGNPGERNIASISIALNLERGDRVHIFVSGAGPFLNNGTDDDGNYYTGVKLGLNK